MKRVWRDNAGVKKICTVVRWSCTPITYTGKQLLSHCCFMTVLVTISNHTCKYPVSHKHLSSAESFALSLQAMHRVSCPPFIQKHLFYMFSQSFLIEWLVLFVFIYGFVLVCFLYSYSVIFNGINTVPSHDYCPPL